jgi:hypothetical protein
MTHDPQQKIQPNLEAYLDGLLEPAEHAAVEAQLRSNPRLAEQVELQTRIDASLRSTFPPEEAPIGAVRALLASRSEVAPPEPREFHGTSHYKRVRQIAAVGLAATLAWVVVGWQLNRRAIEDPYFEPQPVAMVYQQVVERGFEPYYECREADRFASTFERRQGKPLRLAELPPGSHMLGLSYAGGLSRETTSMLCRVDGEPVMVFVDRLNRDLPLAGQHDESSIHVHRDARDGLVFYEVTPFAEPRVLEFLLVDAGAAK